MRRFLTYLAFSLIVALASFAFAVSTAEAATYYVQVNGGTATQCTGLTSAAYPGTGTAQACAWKHPSWALGMNFGAAARIAGGDTLIIAGGDYSLGLGPDGDQSACNDAGPWECVLRPVPSGSAGNPTRILGADYATGCSVKPQLWGRESANHLISLVGSSHVEVGCLELTDRSKCIRNHYDAAMQCARSTGPASRGNWARVGIQAADSANVRLFDLDIHGMAVNGLNAGRLTNWTLERVRIHANGWGGWDGNVGANSSNSGLTTLRHVEVSWNGCSEDWPSTRIIGCWGQQSGGYGDGIGLAASADDWLVEDSSIHHNTSDGLDLLYLSDTSHTTIRRTRAYSNAGNQVKTSGSTLIESSYLVGHCQYFFGKFGSAMGTGDSCRASGNSLSVSLPATRSGPLATIRYSTITGSGDCLILVTGPGSTASSSVVIENSALVGQIDWLGDRSGKPGDRACLAYVFTGSAQMVYRNNIVYGVKDATCATGNTCVSPQVRNSTPDRFDGRPTSTSPLRNAGDTAAPMPATDLMGRQRPQETKPTIGAFEYIP